DDLHAGLHAAQPGDAVALEPAAVDQVPARHRAARRFEHQPARLPPAAVDPRPRLDRAARLPDSFGEGVRHLHVIDDARLGHKQPRDPGDVRLARPQAVGPEALQALQAVGPAAPLQLVQGRQLVRARGDDDLAAALVRDAVLPTEADHRLAALDAVARLERA